MTFFTSVKRKEVNSVFLFSKKRIIFEPLSTQIHISELNLVVEERSHQLASDLSPLCKMLLEMAMNPNR